MLSDLKYIEITGHARGGQGMVTAFEILAKIFSQSGEYEVQAFPSFGVERTGAPIQAYLRISSEKILNRSNIYNPHIIVVFDESLIGQVPVFDGLRDNGIVLLNSEQEPDSLLLSKADSFFTVPASKIAINNGLGSKSLPIVNSPMIGALIRIMKGDLGKAMEIIKKEVPVKPLENAKGAEIAYNSIHEYEGLVSGITIAPGPDGKSNGINVSVTPYWNKPMSLNKTENWRLVTPTYESRTAPCTANCPAGTDVREFLKLTAENKFDEAYEVIYSHNPFPSTCGRVCPHFCQQNCNRNELDGHLNIGAIERFLGDKGVEKPVTRALIKYQEYIAVIGSGPAGLTSALRLRHLGYQVTVFEAMDKAGGMMRKGIPEFRLPEVILDKEILKIEREGVQIITNKKISIPEISIDYGAIIIAVGSHLGTQMNIANEGFALDGIQFLDDVKIHHKKDIIKKGAIVAIIGGGNTAVDVARTVLRLGGIPTIYYRRTRTEMPAIREEIEEALAEGVNIEYLSAPVNIDYHNEKLDLTLIKMKSGEKDESGRARPVPVEGSEKIVTVDHIVKAIGQTYDDFVFSDREPGSVHTGKIDFPVKVPVFCTGDMAWGGTVTEAIGSGNKVAREVHAFLREESEMHVQKHTDIVISKDINYNYYPPVPGNKNPQKKIKDYYHNFSEVSEQLTQDKITEEAGRCLHCGDCYSCGNCFNYCPDAAISINEEGRLVIDYDYCKGCGICFTECPCSAIKFTVA